MKIAVVTGVSRGLGESVAKHFLHNGIHVIGISRSESIILEDYARQNNVTFQHFPCDLGDIAVIETTLAKISAKVFTKESEAIFLVNNAGVVKPVDQAMNIKNTELVNHVHINTIAPMIITNLFLQKSSELKIPLIGLTVSSGAAKGPVFGWSAYCSTKASIDMYTKTAALEQDELQTGNKIIAFNPGIMDTSMQEIIRATSQEAFKDLDTFKDYKKKNKLKNTGIVGGILVDIMLGEDTIINGKVYNVRNYL